MWWKITFIGLSVVIVLEVTLVYVDKRLFNSKVEKEVQELFESAETASAKVITGEDLTGLPEPVKRH